MGRVLEKHKEGIVIKQVAGGKEFKGQAFYSKPDVIHFKVKTKKILYCIPKRMVPAILDFGCKNPQKQG